MALDRIEAMRAFCRIVELGSFTRAADSLGVASTTLSGQIQALERLLDIRLLHRSTRKVHPTNEGLAYYQRARKVIEDIDDLEASVSISRAVVKGRVAVEMPTPSASTSSSPPCTASRNDTRTSIWTSAAANASSA